MKYFPLIWSALWRKPIEAVLVWLAVTAAFTLFGLVAGLHVTYDRLIASSRMDRLDVNARFPAASPDGPLLPIALREQIARIEGVAAVGSYYWLWGYYQDPHKRARIIAVDRAMHGAWPELPLTSSQWDRLFATPTGVFVSRQPAARLGLKAGDTLPLVTAPGLRADGATAWEFHVLGVVPDDPRIGAFILGNYTYLDESRPLQDQGLVWGLAVAVLLETAILALVAAVLGGAAAWLLFDGRLVADIHNVFDLSVTPRLFMVGIAWALTLAILGGLPPAIRAARLSVAQAHRVI